MNAKNNAAQPAEHHLRELMRLTQPWPSATIPCATVRSHVEQALSKLRAEGVPVADERDRNATISQVVGLCNRIPGATTWNAAQFMYDEMHRRAAPVASAPADERAAFNEWLKTQRNPDDMNKAELVAAWEAWQERGRRAALASAPVAGEATKPIVVPDAIRLMAQRIAADDFEHCTADPIFTVQRRDQITGLDLDYDCEVGWFHDGDQITGDKAAALEAAYQESCTVPDDYTRTGIAETWEHFATYVTMEAAQEFVAKKGPKYRVYVDSGCRNHEWKALRAFLLQIADGSYLLASPQASEAVHKLPKGWHYALNAAIDALEHETPTGEGWPDNWPAIVQRLNELRDALSQPQSDKDTPDCSCPSGDGSLRPCAAHPAPPHDAQPTKDGDANG